LVLPSASALLVSVLFAAACSSSESPAESAADSNAVESGALDESSRAAAVVPVEVLGTLGPVGDLATAPSGSSTSARWDPVDGAVAYQLIASGGGSGSAVRFEAFLCEPGECRVGLSPFMFHSGGSLFGSDEWTVTAAAVDESGALSELSTTAAVFASPDPVGPLPWEIVVTRRTGVDTGADTIGIERVAAVSEQDAIDQIDELLDDSDVVGASINRWMIPLTAASQGTAGDGPNPGDSAEIRSGSKVVGKYQNEALGSDVFGPEAGAGILVAVIDSGVDPDHPSLAGRVIVESVGGNNQPGAHGTAMASMIVGNGLNGTPLGTAPGAMVLSIDVSDNDNGYAQSGDIEEAILLAVELGADVISLSYAKDCDVKLWFDCDHNYEALWHADAAGAIVVTAAGNDGDTACEADVDQDGPAILWPANAVTTLTVGGTNAAGERWLCSPDQPYVDVLVPADGILVAGLDGGYELAWGTSLSASMIAGVIAATLQRAPSLSPRQAERLVRDSVDENGQVNAAEIVLALEPALTPEQIERLVASGLVDDGDPAVRAIDFEADEQRTVAVTRGDPHMTTFDGLDYDFQAVGEYVLAENAEVTIHTRFEPYFGSSVASYTTSAALRLGRDIVQIDLDGTLWVNGEPVDQLPGTLGDISIAPNGSADTWGSHVTMVWPEGIEVQVSWWGNGLAVKVDSPARVRWSGLLGDGDGTQYIGDLVGVDGPLNDLSFLSLYEQLAPRWAFTDDTTLFTYRDGQSTAAFFDPAFPSSALGLGEFDPEEVADARRVCVAGGLVIDPFLDDCAFDYLVTANSDAIDGSLSAQDLIYPSTHVRPDAAPVTVTGEIAEEAGGRRFEVEAEPGAYVSAEFVSLGALEGCPSNVIDYEIVAYGQDADTLGEGWPGNEGCIGFGPWPVPASGTLNLVVTSRGHSYVRPVAQTGPYEIRIGAFTAEMINVDVDSKEAVTLTGEITAAFAWTDYRVTGTPGNTLTGAFTEMNGIESCDTARSVDLDVVFYETPGAPYEPGSDASATRCQAFTGPEFPASGELTMRVQGDSGRNGIASGRYTLIIANAAPRTATIEIAAGEAVTINDTIAVPAGSATWILTAEPGTEIDLRLDSMNGVVDCAAGLWNLQIDVHNSQGRISDRWAGSAGCSRSQYRPPIVVADDGQLRITLSGATRPAPAANAGTPLDQTGDFTFTVTVE